MKAVVLEDYAIQQGDLDWSGVKALVLRQIDGGHASPADQGLDFISIAEGGCHVPAPCFLF